MEREEEEGLQGRTWKTFLGPLETQCLRTRCDYKRNEEDARCDPQA